MARNAGQESFRMLNAIRRSSAALHNAGSSRARIGYVDSVSFAAIPRVMVWSDRSAIGGLRLYSKEYFVRFHFDKTRCEVRD